ncbi:MAG: NADH:ubiquinone reductase (Na(+)-transporting) subunit C [Prevotellaceae bacterium]|jgi:Na+-transporting NADH:ubiquinone oxidoreductase subunit C|nr:NADH:ubiquinone reductase (Na(+)-transporting) subunit C [Prevotellaceae bacterium]
MENNSDIKKRKKININGSAYTVIYSVVIVVVVAVLLTIASTALKPAQKLNQEIEKKENILKTVGKVDKEKAKDNKARYITEEYKKYITESFAVDINGNILDITDSIVFTLELKRELAKPEAERCLPVFICKDGEKLRYVLQLHGKGLWGQIWGYIAFENDMNTIAGVVFDHESETPGLGAEITLDVFQKQFEGKQIDEETSLPIIIQKPGGSLNSHTVDGISGGTITSRGVQQMFADNLKLYKGFIDRMKSENKNNSIETNDKNQEL